MFDLKSSVGQEYEPGEVLKYYYLSESKLNDETDINKRTPADVINIVTKSTDTSLAKGIGIVETDGGRTKAILEHSVGFVDGDWLTIVLEDKYGNLKKIYAKVGYVSP